MANKIAIKVLNSLVNIYENSKTFTGDNKNQQSFKVSVSKLFPKYEDDSEYEVYKDINIALSEIEKKGYISLQKERSGKIKSALLEVSSLSEIYEFINRVPKADINNSLIKIWNDYTTLDKEIYKPLIEYIREQNKNLLLNKNIAFFDEDIPEYKCLLNAVKGVLENQDEIFIRELSVKLFNNSKKLESLESKVRSFLYKYGEYDEKDTVLEEHSIIKTPTYVMVKGKGILDFGQIIDLSKINGDIGLSTKTLKQLYTIDLQGASVITIENLTNFHKYQADNQLIIYLGGFHNSIKRDFIKLVKKCNTEAVFFHYGDIDAGGFYILEHLRKKTEVNFKPYRMDKKTLELYKNNWISLTDNDEKRLLKLLEFNSENKEVIEFMLNNNCKLEQEVELI